MLEQKLDPKEVLAETLPEFLAEGPLLVEFKSDLEDVKNALIVTTSPEFCRVDDIPVDNCDRFNVWAWNLHKGGWVLIDLSEVDTVQNWPPQDMK